MNDLPVEVEEVRVVRLQPGDVIIAKVSDRITFDVIKEIKEQIEAVFPGHRTIVASGMEIEVARSDQNDAEVP